MSVSTSLVKPIVKELVIQQVGETRYAALTTNLPGRNNDLVFTALAAGAAGEEITIAYISADRANIEVEVVSTAVNVHYGRNHRMEVSEAGSFPIDQVFTYAGDFNERPSYTAEGVVLYYTGLGQWWLAPDFYSDDYYHADSEANFPDGLSFVAGVQGIDPPPIITALAPSISAIMDNLNTCLAGDPVTASLAPSNDGSGHIIDMPATPLGF